MTWSSSLASSKAMRSTRAVPPLARTRSTSRRISRWTSARAGSTHTEWCRYSAPSERSLRQIATRSESAAPALDAVTKSQGPRVCSSSAVMLRAYHNMATGFSAKRADTSRLTKMCRWNAYFGQPLVIDELLYRMDHGLIDQSRHARMGVETTNGDGFGLGWYTTESEQPCRYRSVTPAWSDRNLRELAGHVESPLFLAHIRATTGTPVQQSNCHPFRHKH